MTRVFIDFCCFEKIIDDSDAFFPMCMFFGEKVLPGDLVEDREVSTALIKLLLGKFLELF